MAKKKSFDKLPSHDHEWADQIDLTPGLRMEAHLVEHPKAGPCLAIASSCPSGTMASRVAPHGWAAVQGACSMPQLPKGWTKETMARVLAVEMPDFFEEIVAIEEGREAVPDKIIKARESEWLALSIIADATKDPLDRQRLTNPLRCFKLAQLQSFAKSDQSWVACPDPIEDGAPAPAGGARVLIPLDRVAAWVDGLGSLLAHMERQGRAAPVEAFLEGHALADWSDLAWAGQAAMFKEVGMFHVAQGAKTWAMDPGAGNSSGGSLGLSEGSYRMWLSRVEGLNVALCALGDGIGPDMAHADSDWRPAPFDVCVDSGLAGFFSGAGKSMADTRRYADICSAAGEEVAAGAWEWGAACSSGDGDGDYKCELLVGKDGMVRGARLSFASPSPEDAAKLKELSGCASARMQSQELAEAAQSAPEHKGRAGRRI